MSSMAILWISSALILEGDRSSMLHSDGMNSWQDPTFFMSLGDVVVAVAVRDVRRGCAVADDLDDNPETEADPEYAETDEVITLGVLVLVAVDADPDPGTFAFEEEDANECECDPTEAPPWFNFNMDPLE